MYGKLIQILSYLSKPRIEGIKKHARRNAGAFFL